MKKSTPAKFECEKCHGIFDLHRYNQKRCIACSYVINTERNTERARLKRLASKGAQS